MSTQSMRTIDPERKEGIIRRATLAGLMGGILFGVMIQFGLNRMGAIGAMYTLGSPSLSVGWVAHVGHSVLFGAVFGFVAETDVFFERATTVPDGIGLGLAFGITLWAVNIVFLWPLWLGTVGLGAAPSLPFLPAIQPLVGHLVYGGILGTVVAVTSD